MSDPEPAAPTGIRQSAGLATIVLVAVIGFIALMQQLGAGPAYAGLLFFWYWGGIGQAKLTALPAMLIGALGGVAIGWLLQLAARSHDGPALIAVLLLIVAAIYFDIMRLVPMVVNTATMLFLTVAAAPLLQKGEDIGLLALSIVLGAGYFGAIVFVLTWIGARRSRASAAEQDSGQG